MLALAISCAPARKISRFELAQGGSFFGLHQGVNPSAAAADACFGGFTQLQPRDGSQQLPWLRSALAMNHVAAS